MPSRSQNAKKFRLFSAVFAMVGVLLAGEAIAPAAKLGNTGYFWWILLLIAFFVPYGLISSELASQYPSEGGLYAWVKKALGAKWAGRVAWFLWINFPLWIAALANIVTTYLAYMLGFELTWPVVLAIQVFYILLVTILGMFKVSQRAWMSNLGAVLKMLFMVGLGGLGAYILLTRGSANPVGSWTDFVPLVSADGSFSFAGLGFVAVIIFCMLGFEVVPAFGNNMQNPKKQVPRMVWLGGILITILYLLSSFGLGVATPLSGLRTDSGLIDGYSSLFLATGLSVEIIRIIVIIVGGMFIYTLLANAASWTLGVNSIAAFAAGDGVFPRSWAKRSKGSGVPYIISVWTGVVAALVSIAGVLAAEFVLAVPVNLFWIFFSLGLVILLIAYLPLFVSFYKLHKLGPQYKTRYRISGGKVKACLLAAVPMILLVAALFFTLFPEFSLEMFQYNWPLIAGTCLVILAGEIVVSRVGNISTRRGRKTGTKVAKSRR